MTNPKLTGGLELILFLLFLVFFASDSLALKIFLNVLLLAYLTFHHYDSVSFLSFIKNQGCFIKVEPKEFFELTADFVIKATIVLLVIFVAFRLLMNLGDQDFFAELLFLNFPFLLQAITGKSNKEKGFYYLFDSGIFALKQRSIIIGWQEVERFENDFRKDHYVFHLKNDEKLMAEKRSTEVNGLAYEEEFSERLLAFVKSKIKPQQVFESQANL